MVRVKINIEEIASSWHVTQIVITDEHFVVHTDTPFPTKEDAERDAREQANRYLQEHPDMGDGEIRWDVNHVPSNEK